MASEEHQLFTQFASINWKAEKNNDRTISSDIDLLGTCSLRGGVKSKFSFESQSVKRFPREWDSLFIENGIPYRTATQDGNEIKQLSFLECHKKTALQGTHDEASHRGKERSLWLARQRFYWPLMEKDVNRWVEQCERRILHKTPVSRPFAE